MKNQLVAETLGLATIDTPAAARSGRSIIYLRVSTSRQATKNGELEGYSIPAQRDACTRKVHELGGEVVAEFVDAGESARSANRPQLKEMLRYIATNPVDYVVVHKVDRLARNRMDDAMIMMEIAKAGATLVSVSENIDDTPSGVLQHGIMATFAEFYSANLALEAKKGIAEKARRGGTHGVAPIGYLNTVARIEGREIKGVALDPERAEHITWAFRTYAAGETSISQLRNMLEERGLRSRTTRKYEGKAMSNSQVHRMLGNPYYISKVKHRGVIHDGAHEALIDDDTWYQVQQVLSGRRLAGDRSWKHDHPLKGSLTCNRCGGRMGFGYSRGQGGTYAYFFCLGRHTGRTSCDLPYLSVEEVEKAVLGVWDTEVHLTGEQVAETTVRADVLLKTQHSEDQKLLSKQRTRLRELELKKKRLVDAYLDGVIGKDDVTQRQDVFAMQIADTKRLILAAETDIDVVRTRVEMLLALLNRVGKLYRAVPNDAKRLLAQAFFPALRIDVTEDEPDTQNNIEILEELAPVVAATLELAHQGELATNTRHTARRGRTTGLSGSSRSANGHKKTPAELSLAGGSNLYYLAVTVGFEPIVTPARCGSLRSPAGELRWSISAAGFARFESPAVLPSCCHGETRSGRGMIAPAV